MKLKETAISDPKPKREPKMPEHAIPFAIVERAHRLGIDLVTERRVDDATLDNRRTRLGLLGLLP